MNKCQTCNHETDYTLKCAVCGSNDLLEIGFGCSHDEFLDLTKSKFWNQNEYSKRCVDCNNYFD